MAGKGVLIYVIGFGIIMGYILLNLSAIGTRAVENMSWYNNAAASKAIATIGINAGLAQLYEDGSRRGTLLNHTFVDGPYSGGRVEVIALNVGFNRVEVRSVSHFNGLTDEIIVNLRELTVDDFKMYGWLTNFPGNDQFFFSGDTVWGPLHANGNFHTHPGHSPVFHGHVQARVINPRPGTPNNRTKFLGGFTQGAAPAPIPDHFNELISAANAGGLTHDGDAWIYMHGNSVHIYFDNQPTVVDEIFPNPDVILSLTDQSFNRTIYIEGTAHIKGVLEGTLSIGAGDRVKIIGDIRYATDPPFETHDIGIVDGIMRQEHEGRGTDLLGVVSANDIIIDHKPANNLSNLTLHGIFFAMGKFDVTSLPSHGVLNTWGSLIQRDGRATLRNPSGNGYRQRYRYDTRLEDGTLRPPAFPGFHVPVGLEVLDWYESVQLPTF